MRHRRTVFWAILFGVALCGVIFSWVWMMQRMLRGEAQLLSERVREFEERYLFEVVSSFSEDTFVLDEVNEVVIPKIVQDAEIAGVWSEALAFTSSAGLSGRDPEAYLFLQGKGELEKLKERVWKYEGARLSSGFRLLLIRELEKREPSPELARLKTAERIRAVEGDLTQLENDYEEIEHNGVSYFFDQNQLVNLFGKEGLRLSQERPSDRQAVMVVGFQKWPWLSLSDPGTMSVSSPRSLRFLRIVSILTGGVALGLMAVVFWMGRREYRLARARTDLAASVAHELRTPLAGQRIILETLEKKIPEEKRYLEMALRENRRLGELAEEFLTFSRLERGVLDLELQDCALEGVLWPLVESFQEQADEGEILFEAQPMTVFADETGIATIARNLIENAWKYSDSPREIVVKIISGGFSVSDRGCGLSVSQQRKIFREFYRVDSRLARSQDGLGLGLAIVKRLVKAMNADLTVESRLGEGTKVTVIFQKGGSL